MTRHQGKIDCELECGIPAGVTVVDMPPPRHNWGDMFQCPNEECGGRWFMVIKEDPDGTIASHDV